MTQASDPDLQPETPAGLGRRFGAMLYDALLLVAIWLITLFIMVTVNSGEAVIGGIIQSVLFLEPYAFFAFFWIRDGQTLGMRAWRLRLYSNRPTRLTLNQVTMRCVGAMLGIVTLGLGYFWMYFDADRRTWPDIFSDSHVMYDPTSRTPMT